MKVKSKIILIWTFLVSLNSLKPLFFATQIGYTNIPSMLGILLGIISFIAIYSAYDVTLNKKNKTTLRKSLYAAAIAKAFLQIIPYVESTSGMLILRFFEPLTGESTFLTAYITTMLEGLVLSIIVISITMIITVIIMLIKRIQTRYSNTQEA